MYNKHWVIKMSASKCYVIDTKLTKAFDQKYIEDMEKKLISENAKLSQFYRIFNGSERRRVVRDRASFSLKLKKNMFGLYLVKVMVNHYPAMFLVDTGAQITTITDRCAKAFQTRKLEGSIPMEGFSGKRKESSLVMIDRFDLGDLHITHQPMAVCDSSNINLYLFSINLIGIDGILGWDILSTLDFEIDDANLQLNILSSTIDAPFKNLISTTFPTLILQGRKQENLIAGFDSGAHHSWISKKLAQRYELSGAAEMMVLGVHGLEKMSTNFAKELRVKLAQTYFVFENVMIGRCDIFENVEFDCVLGNEIIRKRKIRFLNSRGFVQVL